MKTKTIVILAIFAVVLSACNLQIGDLNIRTISGSGNKVTEERTVSGFKAVQLKGIGNLEITQSDTEKLVVEADDNIMPLIETEVINSELVIRLKEGTMVTDANSITYKLTVKDLNAISLSGLGNATAGDLKSDNMDIRLSGSGQVEIKNLETGKLTVAISGLGSANISGKTSSQEISLSGSGDYDGADLESDSATATISGLGSVTVWVKSDLNATISGSGSISYYGDPSVSQKVTGLGNIKSLGTK
ncbi:MAG: DUF2807 domain-containing protein [Anaerolineaceae bacterium]|nr:DUF2807 domain-containing protein [Anaerolineaceae bacterium]NTV37503.1 DUF2807 domain-containing protein [Anaerolineaceae bacterium]